MGPNCADLTSFNKIHLYFYGVIKCPYFVILLVMNLGNTKKVVVTKMS